MDESQFQAIAGQLRKPQGEHAQMVAERMNQGNQHVNRHAVAALELQPNDAVLEIGMANGYHSAEILNAQPGIRYVGCDYSQEMVTAAHAHNREVLQTGRMQFHLAEAHDLPLPDGSQDKVVAVNTLYFWDEPQTVLEEIRRVLKPGGRLVLGFRPKSQMQHYPFVKYGFHMYDTADAKQLLEANGFRVVSSDERAEPEQEFNGQTVQVTGVTLVGEKA